MRKKVNAQDMRPMELRVALDVKGPGSRNAISCFVNACERTCLRPCRKVAMTQTWTYTVKLLRLEIHVVQLIEICSEDSDKRCDEESYLFRHVANYSINISEHSSISQKLIFLHITEC
jgi:hypothetical protein